MTLSDVERQIARALADALIRDLRREDGLCFRGHALNESGRCSICPPEKERPPEFRDPVIGPAGPPGVYLIRLGDVFKIGFSGDVLHRLLSYPIDSEPIATIVCATREEARQLEKVLHSEFAGLSVGVELFKPDAAIVSRFNEHPLSTVLRPYRDLEFIEKLGKKKFPNV